MLSYHCAHQHCFSWLALKSFIFKAQPSVLLEWVRKAPKAALHPSEPHSVPQQLPQLYPQHKTPLPYLPSGYTHCQVNSSTRRSQWHWDGQHMYKQSCRLQGDPKITAGVPFIPTPLRVGTWCSGQVEGGSHCSGSHCTGWELLKDSGIPSQRTHGWGIKHGNKELQDRQKEPCLCPTAPSSSISPGPQSSHYDILFIVVLIQKGAQARLGC